MGVWEIVTGSLWDVRMAWPRVQSEKEDRCEATPGTQNYHWHAGCGGMEVGGGGKEEAAWASGRRVGADTLRNTGSEWRREETMGFFLDVLNMVHPRDQPQ